MKKTAIIVLAVVLMATAFFAGTIVGKGSAEKDGKAETASEEKDTTGDEGTTSSREQDITSESGGETDTDKETSAEELPEESYDENLGEVVFTVGGRKVSMDEVSLYMYRARDKYVEEYGEEPWSQTADDGETVGEYAKKMMLLEITDVQILNIRARLDGITLTAEQEKTIKENADKYTASLGDLTKEFGITAEGVRKVYLDEAVSVLSRDRITDSIMAEIDKSEDTKDLGEEEKADILNERYLDVLESLREEYKPELTEIWDALVMGSVG